MEGFDLEVFTAELTGEDVVPWHGHLNQVIHRNELGWNTQAITCSPISFRLHWLLTKRLGRSRMERFVQVGFEDSLETQIDTSKVIIDQRVYGWQVVGFAVNHHGMTMSQAYLNMRQGSTPYEHRILVVRRPEKLFRGEKTTFPEYSKELIELGDAGWKVVTLDWHATSDCLLYVVERPLEGEQAHYLVETVRVRTGASLNPYGDNLYRVEELYLEGWRVAGMATVRDSIYVAMVLNQSERPTGRRFMHQIIELEKPGIGVGGRPLNQQLARYYAQSGFEPVAMTANSYGTELLVAFEGPFS